MPTATVTLPSGSARTSAPSDRQLPAAGSAHSLRSSQVLPWSLPPAETECLEAQPAPAVLPPHILVVDDDDMVRGFVTKLLGLAGYRVTCAADGEVGWGTLSNGHFDLLITDHEMPRLTGLGLLRRVRAERPELPVIMISARLPWEEKDLRQLLDPGQAIEKPFSFSELLAGVRRMLTPAFRPIATAGPAAAASRRGGTGDAMAPG